MKPLLEIFISFSWSLITASSCSILKYNDYTSTSNDLIDCISTNSQQLIDNNDILTSLLDQIHLRDCIESNNKNDCDNILSDYHSGHASSNYMKALTKTLQSNPKKTCKCLKTYSNHLDHCFQVIDEFNNYCEAFYEDSSTSEQTCYELMNSLCDLSDPDSVFESSMSCLYLNYNSLKYQCNNLLNVYISSFTDVCLDDIYGFCPDHLSDPVQTLSCLFQHIMSVSSECKSRMTELAYNNDIPCVVESSKYCANSGNTEANEGESVIESSLEAKLDCLSELNPSLLDAKCYQFVSSYFHCSADAKEHSELTKFKSKPKSMPASQSNQDDDASESSPKSKPKPNPKHKPKPLSDQASDTTEVGASDSNEKRKPKSKPLPSSSNRIDHSNRMDDFDDNHQSPKQRVKSAPRSSTGKNNDNGGEFDGSSRRRYNPSTVTLDSFQRSTELSSANRKLFKHPHDLSKSYIVEPSLTKHRSLQDTSSIPCWARSSGNDGNGRVDGNHDVDSYSDGYSGNPNDKGSFKNHSLFRPPPPPLTPEFKSFLLLSTIIALVLCVVYRQKIYSFLSSFSSYIGINSTRNNRAFIPASMHDGTLDDTDVNGDSATDEIELINKSMHQGNAKKSSSNTRSLNSDDANVGKKVEMFDLKKDEKSSSIQVVTAMPMSNTATTSATASRPVVVGTVVATPVLTGKSVDKLADVHESEDSHVSHPTILSSFLRSSVGTGDYEQLPDNEDNV